MKIKRLGSAGTCALTLLISLNLPAQNKSPHLTLRNLLEIAEANYPLLKSKRLDEQAAQKNVSVSRSTLIPSLDASYQMDYATYNNITGMVYPQFIIPISGSPSKINNMNGVYGSAASLLLNWQPVTFGLRKGQVDFAKAGLEYADADMRNEIFQHKIKVANAYLDLITASELVKVYRNNLKRTDVDLQAVYSLVKSGIKPGVDSALFKAEVSKAKVDLLNSQKSQEQAQIYLSQLVATDTTSFLIDTLFFSKLPENRIPGDSIKHPLISLYMSNFDISVARKKVITRTAMPTLGLWGTTYARGSGVLADGTVKATDGLSLQRYNYGAGVQLSIPVLQFARIRPQLQQQDFLIQSNQEKLNEIELQLKKQNEVADITITNAYAIAKESHIFLESAQFSYTAMQSRYQSGLANFADFVQAEYVLVKAETDFKLAYIGVWKSILYKAAVSGNLDLFINQVN